MIMLHKIRETISLIILSAMTLFISWIIGIGIALILCFVFGLELNIYIATGIWLAVMVIKEIVNAGKIKTERQNEQKD